LFLSFAYASYSLFTFSWRYNQIRAMAYSVLEILQIFL